MGCSEKKLSKNLTQTFMAYCNVMICQQATLSGEAERPKVADAVIEALSVNQFFLEDIEVLVIQIEAHLQGAIGHPSLAFEEVDDLGEHFIEGHKRPSVDSSSRALASFRSAVSKPSVNQW